MFHANCKKESLKKKSPINKKSFAKNVILKKFEDNVIRKLNCKIFYTQSRSKIFFPFIKLVFFHLDSVYYGFPDTSLLVSISFFKNSIFR